MIEVNLLSKRYGDRPVVDAVSFHCEPGTVTGFVGPNGAGKSTTLRMICGLTRPTAGTARIGGAPYREQTNPGRSVGVLLDATAQHRGRTGREILALSAQILGLPGKRVEEVLDAVGLDHASAGRRVAGYSLGMRQRLGLAHALLGRPEVLILDEPGTGLDPDGTRWLRGLLRRHADAGGTVLLSSHLLTEVERIADRLVVIARGRVVADDRADRFGDLEGAFVRLTGGVDQ